MDKNTIWAILLSALVLIVFMFVQTTFFPTIPQVSSEQVSSEVVEQQAVVPEGTVPTLNEASSVASFDIVTEAEKDETLEEKTFVIETNVVKVTLSNKGGDIIDFELMDHRDGDTGVQMADSISKANRAFALSFGGNDSPIINDIFNVKKINDLSYGFFKKFTVKNTDGSVDTFTLVKQYTFNQDDYMFKLDIRIDGEDGMKGLDFDSFAYTLRTSPQIGPHFNKKQDRYESRTFMSYTNDKKKKKVLGENSLKEYEDGYTWTGVAGKYFTILVVPENNTNMGTVYYSTAIEKDEYANAQVFLTRNSINQKNSQDTYYIYVGPRTEKYLKIYNLNTNNNWNLSGLKLDDSLQSMGLLSWLEAIMKFCMELFYNVVHNWGVSIIIMTILLKILLFPLTKKSSISTLKMQELQPQIKEIQAKYKPTPEKMNAELAKLYKETGYNPLMGCLPLLIQFPLIIAMFNLFNNYFEFRGAMFIPGWIPDLSTGDSIYTLAFSIPFLGNNVRLLPLIYLVSQLFFGKVTQSNTAAGSSATQMKLITLGMPIFFFFMFYNAPAGLLLYWTTSNILQLVQQVGINKMMHRKRAELALSKGSEKPIFKKKK